MQWGSQMGEHSGEGGTGIVTGTTDRVRADRVRADRVRTEGDTIDVSPSIETLDGECQEYGIWEDVGKSS